MNDRPKILLVEDNPTTSKTLVLFLSAAGYEVVCAFDGREGIDGFRNGTFSLVMLDLMLPDIDGLSVCRTIRAISSTPIVILTAKTTEDEIVQGLESGADDYVCKPFGSKELLARVRRCLHQPHSQYRIDAQIQNRQHVNHQTIWRWGNLTIDWERRVAAIEEREIKLTKSEFEILALLVRHPGRVFTRAQLIRQTLGPNFEGHDRTIDTHIWSLRKKMGEPRGNPKYILSELGVGYRMSDRHAT